MFFLCEEGEAKGERVRERKREDLINLNNEEDASFRKKREGERVRERDGKKGRKKEGRRKVFNV